MVYKKYGHAVDKTEYGNIRSESLEHHISVNANPDMYLWKAWKYGTDKGMWIVHRISIFI